MFKELHWESFEQIDVICDETNANIQKSGDNMLQRILYSLVCKKAMIHRLI